jgi:ATP-dependent 26S proteasome regulatory subunit
MKNDIVRISHETQSTRDRIKDNKEKIKVNKTLPYLVSNVIEVIENFLIRFFCLFGKFSYLISIRKVKKMKEQISISMHNDKENARSLKLQHDK